MAEYSVGISRETLVWEQRGRFELGKGKDRKRKKEERRGGEGKKSALASKGKRRKHLHVFMYGHFPILFSKVRQYFTQVKKCHKLLREINQREIFNWSKCIPNCRMICGYNTLNKINLKFPAIQYETQTLPK